MEGDEEPGSASVGEKKSQAVHWEIYSFGLGVSQLERHAIC
jgi:hypothetical protein